jgi:hypothetical protein
MGSIASKLALACALGFVGFGSLLWFDPSPADAVPRGAPAFRSSPGQEVVNGSYDCSGTIYTDDQGVNIWAGAQLNATSGITSGFFGTSQRASEVPADLPAMAEICRAHVDQVSSQVPVICSVGQIANEQYVFGNGTSVSARFDFSCQGTRDEVIGVIGGFSRLSLTTPLP